MKVFSGTVVYATEYEPMVIAENTIIGVQDKKIVFVEDVSLLDKLQTKYGFTDKDVVQLNQSEFLMPGLIDTHIHGPQYVNAGAALDLPLLDWLAKYTFPAEDSFKDINFAREAYRKAVSRVLANGTTTALYNATIHLDATLALCDICEQLGQRAMVGKVCMDQNAPDYYIENTQESLQTAEKYLSAVIEKNYELVSPVLIPRFAVSATKPLMQGIANLINKYNVHVQTHLSENKAECQLVGQLFPWSQNYTDVYNQCGILNNNSSVAHCVHLSDDEITLIKNQDAGISHCPNSNISLKSGLCDVRRLLDQGIKVGLGTDVSGGYNPSILDAIRYTVQTSNILSMTRSSDYNLVDFREAFRLATLGGSQVLGISDQVGTFTPGLQFDALRVDLRANNSPVDIFDRDTQADIVQKFFYLGDDRNIKEVYVAGKQVI